MTQTQPDTVLIPGVHRAIRRLTAGEGPWEGTLVSDGDEVVLWCEQGDDGGRVDWRFVGAEHVAAPIDVARSVEGGGALLPWCTVTVTALLSRRIAGAATLHPGEWVTLVVSLLRGLREIANIADDRLCGQWWLSHDGRPLCVPTGSIPAREATTRVLDAACEACDDRALRRLLEGVHDSVAEEMPTGARVDRWERELLEFAAPRPIRLDEHPAPALGDSVARQVRVGASAPTRRDRRRRTPFIPLLLERLRAWHKRWKRTGRADGHRRSATRHARPRQEAPHSRRRLVAVAGAAAIAVLAVGLLWPDSDDLSEKAAASGVSSASGTPSPDSRAEPGEVEPAPTEDAAQSPDDPGGSPDDPVQRPDAEAGARSDDPADAALALLHAVDACVVAESASCTEATVEGAKVSPDAVFRAADAGEPTLIDDYGDLAVVRIGADGSAQQMLVLLRQDEKWLIRDVYDVADQPVQR